MLRPALIALALIAMVLSAPASLQAQSGDPVTEFSTQDEQMNAATEAARASLPLFLSNVTDADGYGVGTASVKVAFPISDGNEVIWVRPFLWDGGQLMKGQLANQPNYMGDLNQGDLVEFTIDMVRDWSLTQEDGTLWGNYTTRVMLPSLDAQTGATLRARLSAHPVPQDWK